MVGLNGESADEKTKKKKIFLLIIGYFRVISLFSFWIADALLNELEKRFEIIRKPFFNQKIPRHTDVQSLVVEIVSFFIIKLPSDTEKISIEKKRRVYNGFDIRPNIKLKWMLIRISFALKQ